MKFSVHLFAAAQEAVDKPHLDVDVAERATVADLRQALVAAAPLLQPLQKSLLIAVNHEMAADSLVLQETDEIACFPPVSGG